MLNEQLQRIVLGVVTSLAAGIGGCPLMGCAWLNPGGQVRQGLEQAKLYEWRSDGSFWVEGRGTQTETFTMAQGHLVMKENDEGEPVINWEESIIEYYLHANPSADVAGNAMVQALAASTAQAEMLTGLVGDLVSAAIPFLAPNPGTELPSGGD